MTWKSLIPKAGRKSVRKKLNELEDEAMSLPIIFGVLMGKVIENMVLYNPDGLIRFGFAALLVGATYVYRSEKKKAKCKKEKDESQ